MWIVEWSCLSDYEFNVTAWVFEDDAFKAACTDIINHIDSLDFDSDNELLTSAEIINKHIKNKQYKEAIQHWNDCDYNTNNDGAMYWTVRQLTAKRYPGEPPTLSRNDCQEEETTTNSSIIVNDHTCTLCGNAKCSKREGACWSCGHPIT